MRLVVIWVVGVGSARSKLYYTSWEIRGSNILHQRVNVEAEGMSKHWWVHRWTSSMHLWSTSCMVSSWALKMKESHLFHMFHSMDVLIAASTMLWERPLPHPHPQISSALADDLGISRSKLYKASDIDRLGDRYLHHKNTRGGLLKPITGVLSADHSWEVMVGI
jgi:hypothetical protein